MLNSIIPYHSTFYFASHWLPEPPPPPSPQIALSLLNHIEFQVLFTQFLLDPPPPPPHTRVLFQT